MKLVVVVVVVLLLLYMFYGLADRAREVSNRSNRDKITGDGNRSFSMEFELIIAI